MVKRDPRDVLGVETGSSPAQVKAAWRRLARTNHPDLTGDDPAASRAATKRMAEINDAYAALTRAASRNGQQRAGDEADETPFEPGRRARRGGPPAPRRMSRGHFALQRCGRTMRRMMTSRWRQRLISRRNGK